MSTLKLKRGNSASLPVLAGGELAFTHDKKKLLIGDGIENYNFTPVNDNLLFHSDFRYPYITDSTTTVIPGSSANIYGNYFLYNASNSVGNITINKANTTNESISIHCDNAYPIIKYISFLPQYVVDSVITYSKPIENLTCTLSYNISATCKEKNIVAMSGITNSLVSFNVPEKNDRVSTTFNYTSSKIYTNTVTIMNIVLFQSNISLSGDININSVKLELGTRDTGYLINSIKEETLILPTMYQIITTYTRATFVTDSHIYFYIKNPIPLYFSQNLKYKILTPTLYSINGEIITNFTFSLYFNKLSYEFEIKAYKTNHGITDACLYVKLEVNGISI